MIKSSLGNPIHWTCSLWHSPWPWAQEQMDAENEWMNDSDTESHFLHLHPLKYFCPASFGMPHQNTPSVLDVDFFSPHIIAKPVKKEAPPGQTSPQGHHTAIFNSAPPSLHKPVNVPEGIVASPLLLSKKLFFFLSQTRKSSVTSMSTESQPESTLPRANADYSLKVSKKSLPKAPTWKSLCFPWGSTTRTRTSGGPGPQQLQAPFRLAKVDLH